MKQRARILTALALALTVQQTSIGEFRLFDDFEDEVIGPIDGQDDWVSWGGDNRIVQDPDDAANQALYVPSASSVVRKPLATEGLQVPDGTSRMMFLRFRVARKQTFSLGLSSLASPAEFSDFAPEIGTANSTPNLDLRVWDDDGGRYEPLTEIAPDTWYSLWVQVDTLNNESRIWMNSVPGAPASPGDQLKAADGDETFTFRSGGLNPLLTFYIKTAGGSSGTNFGPVYFDAIYIEDSSVLSLWNPTACGHPLDFDSDCDVDLSDLRALIACASGPAVPREPECQARDVDNDNDVDMDDFAVVQRCLSGEGQPADPGCS